MSKSDRKRARKLRQKREAEEAEKKRQADDNHVSRQVGKGVVDVRGFVKGSGEKDS
jgi:hypothetical protein